MDAKHFFGYAGTDHHPEKDATYPCGTPVSDDTHSSDYALDVTCSGCRSLLGTAISAAMRPVTATLAQAGHEEVARGLLIRERLDAWVKAAKINADWDLNPHHQLQVVADNVVADVMHEGFRCSRDEVYLAWLTLLYFHGWPTTLGAEAPCPGH